MGLSLVTLRPIASAQEGADRNTRMTRQLDQTFREAAFRLARDERANVRSGRGADLTPPLALVPRAFHRVVQGVFRRCGGDVAVAP